MATEKRFKRLLLTGAAGGLGSMLRPRLAALCETLRVSDIVDLGEAERHEEVVQCDISDFEATLELTRDVDMVVHMGGKGLEGTWDEVLRGNIIGFYNTFEGCRKNGVRRLVWGSSNHAIGFYTREHVIDASVYPRPDSNYGVSKVFGEAVAQYYWDKFGFETVSIRIGSCFPEPIDRRMLTTWLSYDDCYHLIERCLMASRVAHTVIYGMSDNDMKLWDNWMAAHIGFRPKDNAERFRDKVEGKTETPDPHDLVHARHGGAFAKAGHFED